MEIRRLRVGTYTFLGIGSAKGITYATLHCSSALTALIYIPIAMITYSLQEGPEVDYKPQKQKLPILALIIFLVIASILAAAGCFRNPQKQSSFLGLYVLGILSLVLFG